MKRLAFQKAEEGQTGAMQKAKAGKGFQSILRATWIKSTGGRKERGDEFLVSANGNGNEPQHHDGFIVGANLKGKSLILLAFPKLIQLSKKFEDFIFNIMKTDRNLRAFCHKNANVVAPLIFGSVQPHGFSQQAFDAIALGRMPGLFADRNQIAVAVQICGQIFDTNQAQPPKPPFLEHPRNLRFLSQPNLFGKGIIGHQAVKRFRPLARLRLMMARPWRVAILARNPCFFFRFLVLG